MRGRVASCFVCGDEHTDERHRLLILNGVEAWRAGRSTTATVTVALTFPEGMWDDPAAVVQEVLSDPTYGIATSDSVTVVSAPARTQP